MASTDQRGGFRLPWSGAGAHPDEAPADGQATPVDHAAVAGATPPNRFQPILLRVMRTAAEENRNAMLAACHDDAEASVTALHARSAAEAETLRRALGAEMTAISDEAKAEVARISAEADAAVAARRTHLEQGLAELTARVELDINTVRARVAAFEGDMTTFFGRLDAVEDPAQFAALTSQLPEPPRLRTDEEIAASATAPPAPRTPPAPTAAAAAPPSVAVDAPSGALHLALSAAPWSGPPAATVAAVLQTTAPAAAGPEATASANGVDAPAEPVATDQASADGKTAAKVPVAETPHREPGAPMVTTIVVVGLVNIASIASFKRNVSSLHGVQSVAVSSGPGGEFVFKVTHEPGIALGDEVTLLPGFEARIVAQRDGVLQVSARDPGAAA